MVFPNIYKLLWQDGSVGPTGKMRVDAQQDWTLLARNGTTIVFKRKFDTCDPYDTVITVSPKGTSRKIAPFSSFLLCLKLAGIDHAHRMDTVQPAQSKTGTQRKTQSR